jgi:hypothetical protein
VATAATAAPIGGYSRVSAVGIAEFGRRDDVPPGPLSALAAPTLARTGSGECSLRCRSGGGKSDSAGGPAAWSTDRPGSP